MKKIIISILLICLMALSVSALVPYTGQPILPYLIYGHVELNGQSLLGERVEITNQNTGYTKVIATNSDGYWQDEAGNWLTIASSRPPIQYGDVIKIKALDGCGVGDVCEKTFTAYSTGYSDYAEIGFSLTGNLVCPPASCSPCGGCGSCNCGSGGGGVIIRYKATKEICDENFPCNSAAPTQCPTQPCPSAPSCPPVKECETCQICQEEKVCPGPEPSSPLGLIFAAIVTFLIGGGGVYVTLGKINKLKVIKENGVDKIQHQHPTVSGYHSPDVMHKTAPHKKGELVPKYEKNIVGAWVYKG